MSTNWYAMRSKPNKEEFLFEQLIARDVEAYLPLIPSHAVNPRARKMRPYFPGYLFVHLDLENENHSKLQWIPGGLGLISFGDEIPSVPANLISAVRKRLEEIEQAGGELFSDLKPGDPLQIQDGPFQGYEALFDARIRGTDRVRVLLKLLQGQLVKVDIPSSKVTKKRH
ncbi:MAG: transcription termination/antitermination protein NusG [Bellilinea sp.]